KNFIMAKARDADKLRAAGGRLGLMHGLPIAVKDSINTKDLSTTAGTHALRNFRPKEDAPVADALFRQGAILLGKTNLHELSYGWTSNNGAFGSVRNPYDFSRIPGGSTGGTAAAVAARMVSSGLAEDTCGSVRIPAALCGIAGLRPTTGRYPTKGISPITPLFDTPGAQARSVADLLLYDAVITGDAVLNRIPSLDGVRLGISPEYFLTELDPEVERIFNAAVERLSAAGAVFIRADIPDITKLLNAITYPIQSYDAMPSLEQYLCESGAELTADQVYAGVMSPRVKHDIEVFFRPGGKYHASVDTYNDAVFTHRPSLQRTIARYFTEHKIAAVVHPPTLCPASKIGEEVDVNINGKRLPLRIAYARNISAASCAGIPALVLPAGTTISGLPVGIEFDAPVGMDRELLTLGIILEKALESIPAPSL
ncbi:MAG TPA: amidase family protein, partial [Nitrospirota bacterium]|nr:amidase family protein [Nitrospirota bacterium]